jgi:hypothetical protein
MSNKLSPLIALICLMLLVACNNKNNAYRRFNLKHNKPLAAKPLIINQIIYCGNINQMATIETGSRTLLTDTFYKDTIIKHLITALNNDTLFLVKPFTVQAAPLCIVRDKLFFKPLLDSLSKNYLVNQPHMLPILNLTAYENVTSPPGQIFFMQNTLTILFCVFDKNGLNYVNGQQVYWNRNMYSKNQHVNFKNIEKALKRAVKAYHKQKNMPTQHN